MHDLVTFEQFQAWQQTELRKQHTVSLRKFSMVLQQSIIDDRYQGFIDHHTGNKPKHIRYVKQNLGS